MEKTSGNGAGLKLSHITKQFSVSAGSEIITVLDDISFTLESGSCTLVGGANGSGKSVLMSIIAGLMEPSSGTVKLTGAGGNPADAGLVFQEADAQILGETPLEDVMYGPLNLGLSKKEAAVQAHAAIAKVGLEKKEDYPARLLSGGEKRRLAVAGILALNRSLIIFDEPYANLDYDGIKQVNELILLLRAESHTVIILTHELEKSLGLCDRFIVLCRGRKMFDGIPEEGLKYPLGQWGIRNPLVTYHSVKDLIWL